MKMKYLFVCLLLASILFAGCSSKVPTAPNNSGESDGNIEKKAPYYDPNLSDDEQISKDDSESVIKNGQKVKSDAEISMLDYFLSDGASAHYKGEGNEFAELDIDFAHPYENYIIVHENNGGSLLQHIYRIEDNTVLLLKTAMIDSQQDFPTLKELDALETDTIYLQAPFTKDKKFGKWTVVETGVSLETPYQTFTDVFVIESKEDNAINRKYFAEGFGEVKRESIIDEYIVTSTLESIEER